MFPKKIKSPKWIIHRDPRNFIKDFLNLHNIEPKTDIHFYPHYPSGWHAMVGCNEDDVLIFICNDEKGPIYNQIKKCYGIRKDGSLIY